MWRMCSSSLLHRPCSPAFAAGRAAAFSATSTRPALASHAAAASFHAFSCEHACSHRQRMRVAAAAASASTPSHRAESGSSASSSGRDEQQQEAIAQRIAASRARRAQRVFITCPACGIGVASPAAMLRHFRFCAPDLVREEEWEQVLAALPGGPTAGLPPEGHPALSALLQQAAEREERARAEALHWAFRSGERDGATGQLLRLGPQTVAQRMGQGITPARAKRLISAAMRDVPLVADDIPIEVVHECQHFLAVAKPPRVQTAPVHRYKGGSMVNRVLHYLGEPPHVMHRLDMDTSGVLLFAKAKEVVSPVHMQFRRRTVRKMYLAVVVGLPQRDAWESRGAIGPDPDVTVARRVREQGQEEQEDDQEEVVVQELTLSGSDSAGDSEEDLDLLGSSDDGEAGRGTRQQRREGSQGGSDASGGSDSTWQAAHTPFVVVQRHQYGEGDAGAEVLRNAQPGEVHRPPGQHSAGSTRPRAVCVLAAAPHSGRTHQIRVHAAAEGHSLLGDELYGLQVPEWIGRQALHAVRLQIRHPLTNQPLTMTAPVPEDVRALLQRAGVLPADTNEADAVLRRWVDLAWERLHGATATDA